MRRILVVEDQAAVAELIKLKLKRSGFEVVVALDGLEALKVVTQVNPHLIILDVLIPKIDGYQVFKSLKSNIETKNIPVLVMTARSAMKDSFEGLGAECFITKPFEPDQLVERINQILSPAQEKEVPLKVALITGKDRNLLENMKVQLQSKGYRVELAFDGRIALSKALELLPDLLLLEYHLPQLRGDQIVKMLERHPDTKKITTHIYSSLKTTGSSMDQFLSQDQKKNIRGKENPIEVDGKFGKDAFLDRIKDFM